MDITKIAYLIELLAEYRSRSPHTIGRLVAVSGDFYQRLKDGRDITFGRANRVVQNLSDIWPDDLEWPADIPRPVPQHTSSPAGRGNEAA